MSLNRCSPVWRCFAASAVVVVLLAAACASGDDSGEPAGEEASPEADEPVEPPAESPTASEEPAAVAESGVPDGPAEPAEPAFGVVSVELAALPGTATVVAGGGGIRVSWPPGEPVGGSPVAGYEVQWTPSGQDWDPAQRAVVVGLSYTIFGLDDGVEYAVRVRPAAVETAGVGGASITVGAGAGPVAELVADAPPLGSSSLQSVSTLPGAVNFEMTGEAVWPATITIPVDMGRVGDDSDVLLVYYNESLRAWVPVLGSALDRDRGVITAEVYHLTTLDVVCVVGILFAFGGAVCAAANVAPVVVDALQQMVEFVDSAWEESWLREGWQNLRDFVLEDVPLLAQAILEKLQDTGQRVTGWVRTSLETLAELSIEVLGQLKTMFLLEFGVGIDPPRCSDGRPDWVRKIDADLRTDALLWCDETALAVGSGEADLGLVETVNRGYSMTMRSNSSSVRFGDPSPNRISADKTEFPTNLADLMGSGLHWLVSNGRSAFLPAGAETRFRVPRGALGGATKAEFSYEADIASTHLQAVLYGVNILSGGKASTSAATVEEITKIAPCAWGTFSETANAQSLTLKLMAGVVTKCVKPHIPDMVGELTKSAGTAVFFLLLGGVILLYEYGRMVADGAINPDAHQLTITAHPPTATQHDDTPTTQPGPQQPSRIPGGGTDWTVTLAVGANAQGLAGCQTQHCKHLQIALQGAPDGAYTIACWSSRDTTEPWYTGTWTWPTSPLWTEGGCWYGHPDDQVWVTINDTPSNTITWPTTTQPPPEPPPEPQPTPPAGAATISAVSAGSGHSCGLRSDGTITCWGVNNEGQAEAPGGVYSAVSAGWEHSCGLRTVGTITCWGDNDEGQTEAPGGVYSAVSAGSGHSCGLRTVGTITCWGDNDEGQTEAPTGVYSAVSAGSGHSCGLRSDGTITCWGVNDDGEAEAPGGVYSAASAGWEHSCGLRTDGTITCWGYNEYGQAEAPGGVYSAVTAGGLHSCGLRTDGTITCWGNNSSGQTDAPAGAYTAITAGGTHSCGLRSDGTITCWGRNFFGQAEAPGGTYSAVTAGGAHSCGLRSDGTITCWGSNVVTFGEGDLRRVGQSEAPGGVYSAVTAGYQHSCGLRSDGTITCWGYNEYGQVEAPGGVYSAVTAGGRHSCGLRSDGTITCWGYNEYGQVEAPGGVYSAVTAGDRHSCGLRSDATITCWGLYALDLRGGGGEQEIVAPGASDRSVVLSEGRNAQGVDERCSSANCHFLRVELVGFDLSAGPYAVRCWHYAVPSAGWEHAEWESYTTAQAVSEYCIWGVADHDVYVIVEDPRTGETVRSNDAGWP